MSILYVLKCAEGKYYVGRTSNLGRRYTQHRNGEGSAWTRLYPPERIIFTWRGADAYEENRRTLQLMDQYGIENVRGGSFCQVHLSAMHKAFIQQQIDSQQGACFRCGQRGHYASHCDWTLVPRGKWPQTDNGPLAKAGSWLGWLVWGRGVN